MRGVILALLIMVMFGGVAVALVTDDRTVSVIAILIAVAAAVPIRRNRDRGIPR